MKTKIRIMQTINSIGYVPTLGAMSDRLAKEGIKISRVAIAKHYTDLVEIGLLKDTGELPKWALAVCPHCGNRL